MKNSQYDYSAYDKYLSLKPPMIIWLMIVFLMRPYMVFGIHFTKLRDHTGFLNELYVDQTSLAIGAAIGVLALLMLFIALRRHPTAGNTVKRLWANGRVILITALTLNLALMLFPASDNITYLGKSAVWIQSGICIYFVLELMTSERIRDTFNDFPNPDKDQPAHMA